MTTKSKRGWVLALTSVASLMVALDTLVVSTALTTIREDLGGVFGIAMAVAVFAAAGAYASADAFTDGFAPAMGVAAGCRWREPSRDSCCRGDRGGPRLVAWRRWPL